MNDTATSNRIARLERIAGTLDAKFRLPIIGYRIGWDAILSVVPVLGDAIAFGPAAYIIAESKSMGLPRHKLIRQGINCGIDFAIGSIPVIGTIFDATYKSNLKNVAILREHFDGIERPMRAVNEKAPAEGEGHLSSHHPTMR